MQRISSSQSEAHPLLSLHLAYLFCTSPKLSYQDWKLLHRWLAPAGPSELTYILPSQQILYDPLLILIATKYSFKIATQKSYFIPAHLTLQDQKELEQWIPD